MNGRESVVAHDDDDEEEERTPERPVANRDPVDFSEDEFDGNDEAPSLPGPFFNSKTGLEWSFAEEEAREEARSELREIRKYITKEVRSKKRRKIEKQIHKILHQLRSYSIKRAAWAIRRLRDVAATRFINNEEIKWQIERCCEPCLEYLS